jgi:hypothetical protein
VGCLGNEYAACNLVCLVASLGRWRCFDMGYSARGEQNDDTTAYEEFRVLDIYDTSLLLMNNLTKDISSSAAVLSTESVLVHTE